MPLIATILQESHLGAVRGIFLTGATGFLGAFLLRSILLEYPDVPVWCLLRGRQREGISEEVAMSRLRNHMEDYGLWDTAYSDRIRAVVGDLCLARFGLSPYVSSALIFVRRRNS